MMDYVYSGVSSGLMSESNGVNQHQIGNESENNRRGLMEQDQRQISQEPTNVEIFDQEQDVFEEEENSEIYDQVDQQEQEGYQSDNNSNVIDNKHQNNPPPSNSQPGQLTSNYFSSQISGIESTHSNGNRSSVISGYTSLIRSQVNNQEDQSEYASNNRHGYYQSSQANQSEQSKSQTSNNGNQLHSEQQEPRSKMRREGTNRVYMGSASEIGERNNTNQDEDFWGTESNNGDDKKTNSNQPQIRGEQKNGDNNSSANINQPQSNRGNRAANYAIISQPQFTLKSVHHSPLDALKSYLLELKFKGQLDAIASQYGLKIILGNSSYDLAVYGQIKKSKQQGNGQAGSQHIGNMKKTGRDKVGYSSDFMKLQNPPVPYQKNSLQNTGDNQIPPSLPQPPLLNNLVVTEAHPECLRRLNDIIKSIVIEECPDYIKVEYLNSQKALNHFKANGVELIKFCDKLYYYSVDKQQKTLKEQLIKANRQIRLALVYFISQRLLNSKNLLSPLNSFFLKAITSEKFSHIAPYLQISINSSSVNVVTCNNQELNIHHAAIADVRNLVSSTVLFRIYNVKMDTQMLNYARAFINKNCTSYPIYCELVDNNALFIASKDIFLKNFMTKSNNRFIKLFGITNQSEIGVYFATMQFLHSLSTMRSLAQSQGFMVERSRLYNYVREIEQREEGKAERTVSLLAKALELISQNRGKTNLVNKKPIERKSREFTGINGNSLYTVVGDVVRDPELTDRLRRDVNKREIVMRHEHTNRYNIMEGSNVTQVFLRHPQPNRTKFEQVNIEECQPGSYIQSDKKVRGSQTAYSFKSLITIY